MANDKIEKPDKAAPSKRPTTIDLTATEIKAASAESGKPRCRWHAKAEPAAEPRPETASGGEVPPQFEAGAADRNARRRAVGP